jgi:hypothetical protein
MFNFKPNRLPGFRVGLTDDDDSSSSPAFGESVDLPAFGYDTSRVAPAGLPFMFSPLTALANAESGRPPPPFGMYGPLGIGYPLRFIGSSKGGASNPVSPLGYEPPSWPPAAPARPDATTPDRSSAKPTTAVSNGWSPGLAIGPTPPGPQTYGGDVTPAGYGGSDPLNQGYPSAQALDPGQRTSGGDDSDPIGSAQAQIPQGQRPQAPMRMNPSPGEAVVLPNGLTIPSIDSETGQVMSPVSDLSPVAAAGRQAGSTFRSMLSSPEGAAGALPYLFTMLGLNVGHGGTFDYQRRGNIITGYTQLPHFRDVANINVGLFAQQAGLTLDETLKLAGTFAWLRSSNYYPANPHGLDLRTARYITDGYTIGQTGVFGPGATP